MGKSHECQLTPDWSALESEEGLSRQSLDRERFFGCNPGSNSARNDVLKVAQVAKDPAAKEQQFRTDAGFFPEVDEQGKALFYALGKPIEYTDAAGNPAVIRELSGADLNLLGRAIFAEASGSLETVDSEVNSKERSAIGSVILNRLGARGIRGGRETTVKGVLEAPGQFQSVTDGGKYDAAADHKSWSAFHGKKDDTANLADLRASLDTVRALLKGGPTDDYTSFVSTAYAKAHNVSGTDIGGTRFRTEEEIQR